MDAAALGLREASLDLVVSLYDSLNYITEVEGIASCFRGVAHALRPGGLFIFDLNTPRALRSGFFTQDNLRSGEPLLYRWQADWDESRKLCRVNMWFRWRGAGEATEFRETHYERAYQDGEVRSMLEAAGLRVLTVYDAYGFRPASRLSTRWYYVARSETPGSAELSLEGTCGSSR